MVSIHSVLWSPITVLSVSFIKQDRSRTQQTTEVGRKDHQGWPSLHPELQQVWGQGKDNYHLCRTHICWIQTVKTSTFRLCTWELLNFLTLLHVFNLFLSWIVQHKYHKCSKRFWNKLDVSCITRYLAL